MALLGTCLRLHGTCISLLLKFMLFPHPCSTDSPCIILRWPCNTSHHTLQPPLSNYRKGHGSCVLLRSGFPSVLGAKSHTSLKVVSNLSTSCKITCYYFGHHTETQSKVWSTEGLVTSIPSKFMVSYWKHSEFLAYSLQCYFHACRGIQKNWVWLQTFQALWTRTRCSNSCTSMDPLGITSKTVKKKKKKPHKKR